MELLMASLDELVAPQCWGCTAVARGWCAACASQLPRFLCPGAAPPHVAWSWSLGPHEGGLAVAIRRAKYDPCRVSLDILGRELASRAEGRLPRVDLVTHIPASRARAWRRGFDQGEVLARWVAQALGRPHQEMFERHGWARQVGKGRRSRLSGARRSLRARRGLAIAGLDVLLVDDVRTTGASAQTCAEELLGSGAHRVGLLSLSAAD